MFINISNSANSVTKIFVITEKEIEPATYYGRDQDVTTVSRHVYQSPV